jgi:hypothetical protein
MIVAVLQVRLQVLECGLNKSELSITDENIEQRATVFRNYKLPQRYVSPISRNQLKLTGDLQCADTSWNLCGGTTGYFCCLVGTTCYGLVVNGVNAVGCLPAGEALSAGQTAIGTVQAGVTSSTPSVTSTTMSTTASTTGECDSSLTEHTPRVHS